MQCACTGARQMARVLTQLYDSRFRRIGLEAPQFALLATLEQAGPCNQVDLGKRYSLEKTTVSRNLRLLEGKGWIAASIGKDRRERKFTLTAAGREMLAAAKPQWKKTQDELLAGMSTPQWDEMFRMFGAVTSAAQRLQEEERKGKA